MTFVFVSNYINHHQIPFCEAMAKRLGDGFVFISCAPMDEERRAMGWGKDLGDLPYVISYDDDPAGAERLMREADAILIGWTERDGLAERITAARAAEGKIVFRVSERIYREGQWKALSPRGLLAKRGEFTRFRKDEVYLLCAGAYVASDFALIGAFPGKRFRWGYFPPLRTYAEGDAPADRRAAAHEADPAEPVRILYAGRFMSLKHPEFALHALKTLREEGVNAVLEMIGDGETADSLHSYAAENGLSPYVTFPGFLPPKEVRDAMEKADIFVFPSNRLEGWGAVVSEAMNSSLAVVAGTEAGAAPFLIENGKNGLLFNGEKDEEMTAACRKLALDAPLRRRLGLSACRTILSEWNADTAAERLLAFCGDRCGGTERTVAGTGPMSPAPVIRPFIRV